MSARDYETLRDMHTHWYEQDAMVEACSCQTRWPCDLQTAFDEIDRLGVELGFAKNLMETYEQDAYDAKREQERLRNALDNAWDHAIAVHQSHSEWCEVCYEAAPHLVPRSAAALCGFCGDAMDDHTEGERQSCADDLSRA